MKLLRLLLGQAKACSGVLVLLLTFPFSALADITQVSNGDLKLLRERGVALIDVRRPDEWQLSGMIEGSHPLTFFDKTGKYDIQAWLAGLQEIAPNDQPFVLICEVGGRTGSISKLLDQKLGYTGVHNLTKGIRHWIKAGEPTVAYQPR